MPLGVLVPLHRNWRGPRGWASAPVHVPPACPWGRARCNWRVRTCGPRRPWRGLRGVGREARVGTRIRGLVVWGPVQSNADPHAHVACARAQWCTSVTTHAQILNAKDGCRSMAESTMAFSVSCPANCYSHWLIPVDGTSGAGVMLLNHGVSHWNLLTNYANTLS